MYVVIAILANRDNYFHYQCSFSVYFDCLGVSAEFIKLSWIFYNYQYGDCLLQTPRYIPQSGLTVSTAVARTMHGLTYSINQGTAYFSCVNCLITRSPTQKTAEHV